MTSTETSGWSPSATRTAAGVRTDRFEPDRQRARESALRVGVHDPALRPPLDGSLDGPGVAPEHDDDVIHPGRREGIEDVLEDRPAADRRQQLAAPEARPGARRQHESDRPSAHPGIFAPSGPKVARVRRAPSWNLRSVEPQAFTSARSRIGAPVPP